MRVCLVSRNDHVSDPRARALRHTLLEAGHDVVVVAVGERPDSAPAGSRFVPARWPRGRGRIRRAVRVLQPRVLRQRSLLRRLRRVVGRLDADIVYPMSADLVASMASAVQRDTVIVRRPGWPDAGARDAIWHWPDRAPAAQRATAVFHTPFDARAGSHPADGRHHGRSVVLAYRRTATNPGRYLQAALERAGVQVTQVEGAVDLARIPRETDAVVFVESPYPPLPVTGEAACPVLFWVHHGEHHLPANLRLVERYRVDGVLLAHSWHLEHRFPCPVMRFPFAIDTCAFDASRPWHQRRHDVAMVGAHLRGGGPYPRRQELVTTLESAAGLTTAFREGIPPEEMVRTYEDARIVVNEGGERHYPITMRVFEAVSAGALLLTDPIPGLQQLFEPERHFIELEDDVVAQARSLLASERSAHVAAEAHDHAQSHHTYDHRVDELFQFASELDAGGAMPVGSKVGGLPGLIDDDVEVTRIAADRELALQAALPDREVWDLERVSDRLTESSYEAVALQRERVDPEDDRLIRAARRYLYIQGAAAGLEQLLAGVCPDATVERHGERLVRVDLHAPGYRVSEVRT